MVSALPEPLLAVINPAMLILVQRFNLSLVTLALT